MKEYEAVVIGAGAGGYEAALELGRAGVKTLLVEREKERIGGVCLNEGCVPTKNYLESASFISVASRAQKLGVIMDVKGLNLERLREETIALKTEIRTGVLWMLEQAKVQSLYGEASFVDAHSIEVSGETISFEKAIVATGSQSRKLPLLPIDSKKILSSDDVFELTALPKSIAIVGVGAIGCEFATFFSSFGVEVTLIGRGSQLLPHEDEDVSKALLRAFKKRGVRVMTSATISKAEIKVEEVELFINQGEPIKCELVLVAAGRTPYVEGLNLQNAGINRDEKGFIEVSPSFQTSQSHVYAIGDCVNTPGFAHAARAEAKVAASNVINARKEENASVSPSAVFSDPSVASCGLREKEAKARGIEVEVKKAYFKANAKAKIHGDDSGFVKIIVCPKSGIILGAAIIGAQATEIIHELLLAIEKKLTTRELKGMIHVHPSVSEIISYL